MQKKDQKNLYVTIGIPESDPGFSVIKSTLGSFDHTVRIGACLWQIQTAQSLDQVFQTFNANMVDRRIDSSASLLLLDPANSLAKWHLRQPLSDLIASQWSYQNNLLISFSLGEGGANAKLYERITQLGIWAPLSKTVWYVSSPNTSQDAFHYLLGGLSKGDSLSILDGNGNVALWQQSVFYEVQPDDSSTSPLSTLEASIPSISKKG